MPGKDAPVGLENLLLHHLKLIAQGQQTIARGRRHAVIIAILDDLQQPLQPIAADACDNTEFGQMGPERIDQRGALADEQVAGPCSIRTDCCSGVLISTNRMVGRVTASQIASASAMYASRRA